MLTETVFTFFPGRGAKAQLARALNITTGAISQWGELVPKKQAQKIEHLTDGALRYDPQLYIGDDLRSASESECNEMNHNIMG